VSLLAVVVLVLSVWTVVVTRDTAPASRAGGSVALPFAMPSTEVLRSSPRLVFANYFPPLPVSLDNRPAATDYYTRDYLRPEGESGKHAAYGGYLRDRPVPRPPRPETDWRLLDLEAQVRQAIAGGLDGFSVDVLALPDNPDVQVWKTTRLLFQAAQRVDPGFRLMLMPDLAGALKDVDVRTLARYVALLGAFPAAYHLDDGRLVVMPSAAENHDPAWWQQFIDVMRDEFATPVALIPLFIANERDYRAEFAPLSYAMTIWGSRNPTVNDPQAVGPTSPLGRAQIVQGMGLRWVQPVSVQDERPRAGIYDEAENTRNLRNTWEIARQSHASWAHVLTWNDYSEGTELSPSLMHGFTFIDLNAYYLTWYKMGAPPPIIRDTIYLTHRTQPFAALPSYPTELLMQPRPRSSPPRDTAEALVFLTAPARVTVRSGHGVHTCSAPAGVSSCLVPLAPGTVSATVDRNGTTVASVASPYVVTATPTVQDLQYVGVSSRRPLTFGQAGASGPAKSSSPEPSAAP
jgi:hypothetical protein